MPTKAIVRRPSPDIDRGEVTHLEPEPVDVTVAHAQHAAYVATLERLGLEIVYAPEAPEHPDGLFVEDTVFVVAGTAIVTRPGALSRRNETVSIVPILHGLGIPTLHVVAPATIDGGDVLVTDRHVFVGQSTRTNAEALAQVAAFVSPLGRTAIGIDVTRCLHLKSAITALPDGSLIAVTDWVDVEGFEALGYRVRSALDHSGGDLLCVGDTVVVPASAGRTAQQVRDLGFPVETVDVHELQKIESGVTCMSVLI